MFVDATNMANYASRGSTFTLRSFSASPIFPDAILNTGHTLRTTLLRCYLFLEFSVWYSAMQVYTASDTSIKTNPPWQRFWQLCTWFPIAVMGMVLFISLVLMLLFSYRFVDELYVSVSYKIKKRRTAREKPISSIV
jgi:hypothetical protein